MKSPYEGNKVRIPHGYTNAAGVRVPGGSLGTCTADHPTLLSVQLELPPFTINIPHAYVDILDDD